ncbi:hypothetical protein M407DRAFT_13041 [Tulasnella calospora MUT 4182]|uniref:Uncharacterized protein n=1 Tax=Tulasnella calospora MUT 4182 TaxID=1051891 RepID=A0A0C3L2M3_9AGAM|nr:hypothetical protein M407DRAFT_13041 [Tulasnella calospora MUT 4182]
MLGANDDEDRAEHTASARSAPDRSHRPRVMAPILAHNGRTIASIRIPTGKNGRWAGNHLKAGYFQCYPVHGEDPVDSETSDLSILVGYRLGKSKIQFGVNMTGAQNGDCVYLALRTFWTRARGFLTHMWDPIPTNRTKRVTSSLLCTGPSSKG